MNVAATLAYLHGKGYFHGGLNIHNILIESGTKCIKLLDVSLYRFLEENGILFPSWQKEMLPYQTEDVPVKKDLYAAGCILCYLLTGSLSFSSGFSGISDNLIKILERVLVYKNCSSAKEFYNLLLKHLEEK